MKLIHADGCEEPLAGCAGIRVNPGDAAIIETPGGGGYGQARLAFDQLIINFHFGRSDLPINYRSTAWINRDRPRFQLYIIKRGLSLFTIKKIGNTGYSNFTSISGYKPVNTGYSMTFTSPTNITLVQESHATVFTGAYCSFSNGTILNGHKIFQKSLILTKKVENLSLSHRNFTIF